MVTPPPVMCLFPLSFLSFSSSFSLVRLSSPGDDWGAGEGAALFRRQGSAWLRRRLLVGDRIMVIGYIIIEAQQPS